MSSAQYPNEKEQLPEPITAKQRKPKNLFRKIVGRVFFFFALLFLFDAFTADPQIAPRARGCSKGHSGRKHMIPFNGTTHFELDPAVASGLTIKGANAFGHVVFETSKLSDKVIIDLDIKLSAKTQDEDVTAIEEDGYLTVSAPETGKVHVLSNAKIQIPSNIIGKFGLPSFELDVVHHHVDYSDLPTGLEIGDFSIKVAKGSVKAGKVNTNQTTLDIASGNFTGAITYARHETSINIASGNATFDATSITAGQHGESTIRLGNGDLKGNFAVYNSSTFDVAKGDIYITVDIEDSDTVAELNTKAASGDTRVYVKSIAENRMFKSYHTAVSGDHLVTYPSNFEGTISCRSLVGDIKLEGEELTVGKKWFGMEGTKGDAERNYVDVKTAKGTIDFYVGDEE